MLLLPLLLLPSRLQKLYEIFQQEKAASLLLTLIAYAQLLGASLLSLHDAFDLQLFLLVLCVMFTICADTLLLPLLHAIFLSLQEERRLAHLYETYEKQLQRRMHDKSDGHQLRRMRHDIINLIQTIATAKERKEDAHEE